MQVITKVVVQVYRIPRRGRPSINVAIERLEQYLENKFTPEEDDASLNINSILKKKTVLQCT